MDRNLNLPLVFCFQETFFMYVLVILLHNEQPHIQVDSKDTGKIK